MFLGITPAFTTWLKEEQASLNSMRLSSGIGVRNSIEASNSKVNRILPCLLHSHVHAAWPAYPNRLDHTYVLPDRAMSQSGDNSFLHPVQLRTIPQGNPRDNLKIAKLSSSLFVGSSREPTRHRTQKKPLRFRGGVGIWFCFRGAKTARPLLTAVAVFISCRACRFCAFAQWPPAPLPVARWEPETANSSRSSVRCDGRILPNRVHHRARRRCRA